MRLAFLSLAASLALISTPADAATYVKGNFRGVDPVTGLEIEGRGAFLFGNESQEEYLEDVVVYLQWVNGFIRIGDTIITPENAIGGNYYNNSDGTYQYFTNQFSFSLTNGEASLDLSTVFFPFRGEDYMTVRNATATVGGAATNYSRPNISGFFYVTAVPEPMTWAFLILGFGAVGGAMRRAKQGDSVRVSYS